MSNSAIAAVLSLLFVAVMLILLGLRLREALKTGVVPYTDHRLTVSENPSGYWLALAFMVFWMVLLIPVAGIAVYRLAEGA